MRIAKQLFLHLLDHQLKGFLVLGRQFLDSHHDIAVHLDEATVTVPSETRVATGLSEGVYRFVIEAKV